MAVVTEFAETSTLLGANGVIAGAWHDTGSGVSPYTKFRAFAASNVASAPNGLIIQQSEDQTLIFTTNTVFVAANFAIMTIPLEALIVKRYVRAQYTNGVATQSGGFFNFSTALVSG